ncbi:chemotaxis protein [Virgibacillus kekensis]|uniref:Chemotaxis protein n=1 Tax=Virgibacillus kekensis TaxID=202261 RepID=A0ABV9DG14_9BACI
MTQKIAVMILHGAGTPERQFAEEMMERITKSFVKKTGASPTELVFEPVFWSSIFAGGQEELWENFQSDNLHFQRLRKFAVEFLADAVAYQPTDKDGQNYDQVHTLLAKSIRKLKERAGERAPLCVISHSLGSIVASNYFFDLQYRREKIGVETRLATSKTPIEQCETLTLFYTMGSPMALWSMRYIDFGSPIMVPSPELPVHYPDLKGEWLNFYDKDDVLSYPLKNINEAYNRAVTRDVSVNAGGMLTSWNPISHIKYDTDKEVISSIVNGLCRTWKTINND